MMDPMEAMMLFFASAILIITIGIGVIVWKITKAHWVS